MNCDEIRKALEIIKKPITVNCIEYKYFDQENYIKLEKVFKNCLWFANNLEQINLTTESLEQENKQLKDQIDQLRKELNALQTSEEEITTIEQLSKHIKEMIAEYEEMKEKIEEETIDEVLKDNNLLVINSKLDVYKKLLLKIEKSDK